MRGAPLLAVASLACGPREPDDTNATAGRADDTARSPPWNVVVVMTDDQRFDSLWAMPHLMRRLENDAVVTFTRAYATTPLCCPARASLFAGGFYPHATNVMTNLPPNGGHARFVDERGLAVELQVAGYRTALVGKWLNGLELAPAIPVGFDRFEAMLDGDDWFDWSLISAETGADEAIQVHTYMTDYVFDRGRELLAGSEPFALFLTPYAPHSPAEPHPDDLGAYADAQHRPPSWFESDVTDKPVHVQDAWRRWNIGEVDAEYRSALETLLAVDRNLDMLLRDLEESGRLDRTLVLFTSDQGTLWGEHGLVGKGYPYEENLRVPLVAWVPGLEAAQTHDALVAASCDIAATIQGVAGVPHQGQGLDLLGLVNDTAASWRDSVFLESYLSTFAGVVTPTHKYIEHLNGKPELYDLVHDPDEMDNVSDDPAFADVRDTLAARVDAQRGVWIGASRIEVGAGIATSIALPALGGTPPYTWELAAGTLPAGVTLSTDGVLAGTFPAGLPWFIDVRVTDASVSPATGGPTDLTRTITVAPVGSGGPPPLVQPELLRVGDELHLRAPSLRAPELLWSIDRSLDAERHRAFVPHGPDDWRVLAPPSGRHPIYVAVVDGAREVVPTTPLPRGD